MTKATYEDWIEAVRDELKARDLDAGDAFDNYAFWRAYDEYGLTPRDAVQDYQDGMEVA